MTVGPACRAGADPAKRPEKEVPLGKRNLLAVTKNHGRNAACDVRKQSPLNPLNRVTP